METIEQLEAQLAAAEAANKAAREAVAQQERVADIRARILAEQNAARDLPRLAELEGSRGVDYDVVVCRLGSVAVRKPAPVVWKRFQTSKQDPRDAADALVRSCLAYPALAELNAILDDQPASLEAMALTVARLAGADIERIQGKS